MVTLKVTHSQFDKVKLVDQLEAPTRHAVLAAWIMDYSKKELDHDALIYLLSYHSDMEFKTPTWGLHFELSYRE